MTSALPTVTVARAFPHAIERVFDAFLNPALASKFLFATPTGTMIRSDIDPCIGGQFNFTDRRPDGDVEHVGTYLEITRPTRLVFEFGVPKYSREMTRVTLDLVPTPTGCQLTLTHEGVLPDYAARTQQGWTTILANLDSRLDSADYGTLVEPGVLRFERNLPGPVDRVWSYLTDPAKRATWLADGPMDLRPGGKVELVWRNSKLAPDDARAPEKYRAVEHEARMTGQITRITPNKVLAFSWGPNPDKDSEVTFELVPANDRVRLIVTHRKVPSVDHLTSFAGGWHTHLGILADQLNDRVSPGFWRTFTALEPEYAQRLK